MLYRGCRHAEEGRLLTQSAPSRTPTDPRPPPPPPPPPPPAPPSGMIGRTPGQPSRIGREAEAIRRTRSGITRIASSRRQIPFWDRNGHDEPKTSASFWDRDDDEGEKSSSFWDREEADERAPVSCRDRGKTACSDNSGTPYR